MAPKARVEEHGDPDEAIAQVRPQQGWHHHGDNDQHASHGRRPGFLLMGLGAVFADVLADLEFAQPANYRRADDQPHKQRGEAGEGCAKRQIAEDTERADMKVRRNPSDTAANRANHSPSLDYLHRPPSQCVRSAVTAHPTVSRRAPGARRATPLTTPLARLNLAVQPLARFLRSGDKLGLHVSRRRAFDNGLRQPPHPQY